MRSILVYADRKPGNDARIETALAIARHAGGHLTVLVDTPVARYVATDPMGGSYVMADALEKARADDDAAADAVRVRLDQSGVPFDIVRCEDDPVTAFSYAARLADLVVVPRSDGIAGDLALATRAPILALADETTLAMPVRRACIAWDGSEQAAAALRAAVPLLAPCEAVTVITVNGTQGGSRPGDLPSDSLAYLARHGIRATIEERERGESIEHTLALAITEAHADLVVMGAYGKSRVREFLFGGVTAHFLNEDAAPALLLAH